MKISGVFEASIGPLEPYTDGKEDTRLGWMSINIIDEKHFYEFEYELKP